MSYVQKSNFLKDSRITFKYINDSTDINLLQGDSKPYCVYTFNSTPNFKFLDQIKDKVFLVGLLDTSLHKIDTLSIIQKFFLSDYDIDKGINDPLYNNILQKYNKPQYLTKQNKITKPKLKKWFNNNEHLLKSSKFSVMNFGSFLGGDLDLLVTKKAKVTIKEVSSFLKELIDSGNKLGITIEPFYCNDKDYFNIFYYKDNSIENKNVLMGWYADNDYPALGKKYYKHNLCLMYYPWRELFYQSCHKDEVKKLITNFSDLNKDLDNVHITPSIYYTLFNRYGNLKTISRWK